jgi:hypothetical protein
MKKDLEVRVKKDPEVRLKRDPEARSSSGGAADSAPAPTAEPSPQSWAGSWVDFWFKPVDPIGLHVFRVLTGLAILFWLLTFLGSQNDFFGLQGWLDRLAFKEAARQGDNIPAPISWSLLFMANGNPIVLNVLYAAALLSVVLFTLGVATRWTGVLTWLTVASFLCNPAIFYDADYLLVLLAFYLMLGYLLLGLWNGPRTLSALLLGSWFPWAGAKAEEGMSVRRGRAPASNIQGSVAANLVLRLVQIHFAIVILVGGLHKLQFGDWWAGVAFWYPLHPPMTTTPEQIRAQAGSAREYLFFLSLGNYLLLTWQLTFPFVCWRRGWRPVLLGGALIYWIGSIWLYRLPGFGPVVFIACLSFVTAAEWRSFGKGLIRAAQLIRKSKEAAVTGELASQRS